MIYPGYIGSFGLDYVASLVRNIYVQRTVPYLYYVQDAKLYEAFVEEVSGEEAFIFDLFK